MSKTLDTQAYTIYINMVNKHISEIEEDIKKIDNWRKISNMDYDTWVMWQNGEIKLGKL